jgi:Spy/CpxP family protein refolding chaperone
VSGAGTGGKERSHSATAIAATAARTATIAGAPAAASSRWRAPAGPEAQGAGGRDGARRRARNGVYGRAVRAKAWTWT